MTVFDGDEINDIPQFDISDDPLNDPFNTEDEYMNFSINLCRDILFDVEDTMVVLVNDDSDNKN